MVLQLERLMDYPMVREQVGAGKLALHGWHYVIEDGEVHVFDVQSGAFVAASDATHSGTGPYPPFEDTMTSPVFNEIDEAYGKPAKPAIPDSGALDRRQSPASDRGPV